MSLFATENDSHARRMDQMYRFQRHIYDLTRKYYLLGRDTTIRQIDAKPGQSILELGCGTGRNLRKIAGRYPQSRPFGLDISEEMLISARKGLTRDGVSDPVLVAADATNFTPVMFEKDGFDHILISYALSMIPDWEKTIHAGLAALVPGGTLHIVDFGQQERLPRWFAKLLTAWLHQFHVTPRENLESITREAAKTIGAFSEFSAMFRGYAWQVRITRPL